MQNLFRLSLCRRIVILLAIAAHIQVPLSIWEEMSADVKIKTMDANRKFYSSFLTKKNVTNLPRGEEVASLDRFKDERAEVRGSWEVRLWQRLLHLLDLHETQSPVLPWGTMQQHQKKKTKQKNSFSNINPTTLLRGKRFILHNLPKPCLFDKNSLVLISVTDQWSSEACQAPSGSGSGRQRSAQGCGSGNSWWH